MKIGTVVLIYMEEILVAKSYHSAWERRDIIKKWAEKYKKQWGDRFSLLIIPKIDIRAVRLDGTNKKKVDDKELKFS